MNRRTIDADQAESRARAFAAHWEAHDFGLRVWEMETRPVAIAGLHFRIVEGRGVVEASFAVAPHHWGEGLAVEAMQAALGEAPEICSEVAAVAYADNARGLRTLEKLEFEFVAQAGSGESARHLYRRRVLP